jgi:hypothetical protein
MLNHFFPKAIQYNWLVLDLSYRQLVITFAQNIWTQQCMIQTLVLFRRNGNISELLMTMIKVTKKILFAIINLVYLLVSSIKSILHILVHSVSHIWKCGKHKFSFFLTVFQSFQSFHLSVFLSFCLSVFLPFCLSAFLPFCLSVFLPLYVSAYQVSKGEVRWHDFV